MITHGMFPPDIRIDKEIKALTEVGHEVLVICIQSSGQPLSEKAQGIQILRVPFVDGLRSKRRELQFALTFFESHCAEILRRGVKEFRVDAVHIHDLPWARTGLQIGQEVDIPVIVDFHENYPAALDVYSSGILRRLVRGILRQDRPEQWALYEVETSVAAHRIVVVVEEAKSRLISLGIKPDKIHIVENTVDVEHFLSIPINNDIRKEYKEEFVISYIGGFGRYRGLDTSIRAMPHVLRKIPHARLLLVGGGTIKPLLEKMVSELNLVNKVSFVDWQPFSLVPTYISLSEVCLIPHHSNPHTETTNPHKLYQYMAMAKPVVVSSCRPLERVVKKTGAGRVFQAGDEKSLAEEIVHLQDQALRHRLGESGKRAVFDGMNWKSSSQVLTDLYENIDAPI